MFTVEQRDALRARVLQLAEEDERVVAGAAVGSLAVENGGDRFSDLDLTFGIADGVPVAGVLADWTRTLTGELDAVHLLDLAHRSTIYRVFLLPNGLQLDVSMAAAAEFRALRLCSWRLELCPHLRVRPLGHPLRSMHLVLYALQPPVRIRRAVVDAADGLDHFHT